MKKISYLIFILIAFIVLIPRVDAKEIDVSNFELARIHYYGDDELGYYSNSEGIFSKVYTFSIPSFYQLPDNDRQIPAGKKVKITLSIGSYCGVLIEIFLHYSLIDDVKKNVIYNNTFDAVNDNVESYYEGEADILLKDIKREGYKFLGWYTTSDYKEDSRITVIDKDVPETLELYAKWEKIESQVKKDNIEENPNTYTTTYVIAGIFIILMLSTVIVYIYGKKNNI